MNLKRVRIQNYKSILDSDFIDISDVTVLVGPNQSGKTSLMEGISTLSVDIDYEKAEKIVLTQHNSINKKYMDGDLKASEIEIVSAEFDLDTTDKSRQLETLIGKLIGNDISEIKMVVVSKFYDSSYQISIGDKSFRYNPDYSNKIKKIIEASDKIATLLNQYTTQLHAIQQASEELKEIEASLKDRNMEFFTKAEFSNFLEKLKGLIGRSTDQNFKNAINPMLEGILKDYGHVFHDSDENRNLYVLLKKWMPRQVLVKTYKRLESKVSINDLSEHPDRHEVFANLLKIADLRLTSLKAITDSVRKSQYLESCSGNATKILKRVWNQEDLDVVFRLENSDHDIAVYTKDSRVIGSLILPEDGSEGFQWYLGFYITFAAATEREYNNAIILLDDPAVNLHPSGHKDFLDLMENLAGKNRKSENNLQVIYSTHLPSLIPLENIERIRLVTKIEESGKTNVTSKFWKAESGKINVDVYAPIRTALGVRLADSLITGKKVIIVEGPSDKIIIENTMRKWARINQDLFPDEEDIFVLPAGGAETTKYSALVQTITAAGFIVILDNDDEGKKAFTSLEEVGVPSERIFFIDKDKAGSSIEDMFSPDVFVKAVQMSYPGHDSQCTDLIEKLKEDKDKKYLNVAKEVLGGDFIKDKVTFAKSLIKAAFEGPKMDDYSKDKFDTLFKEISGVLQLRYEADN